MGYGVALMLALSASQLMAQEHSRLVNVVVTVVGDDLTPKAVPLTEFSILQGAKEVQKLVTDLEGHAELMLTPGQYTIKSSYETRYLGIAYEWQLTFDVLDAVDTRLLLSNANAQQRSYAGLAHSGRRQSEESLIFESVGSGVFTIYGIQGKGSGFLVDPRGLVVTNAHVVQGTAADEARIQISQDRKLSARILTVDEKRDVAVLLMNMEHCFDCAILELAAPAEGPIVAVGEKILAIGSPLNQTQILTTGIVGRIENGAIMSDVNINQGNSGGPLLTLDGRVVGINTFHDPGRGGPGVSGAILITEAMDVLREAKVQLEHLGHNPVSPALLPTVSEHPFPIELLKVAAARDEYDLKRYQMDVGPFEVLIMTPPIMAWRQSQAMKELTARRSKREAEAELEEDERIDPIQTWHAWDQYIGERKAVVIINVIPEVGETRGSIFRGILSGISAGLSGRYYPTKSTLEFKGDFRRLTLLRDRLEIAPIDLIRVPAILNIDTYLTEGKDYAYQGIYVFRPENFRPNSDGSFSEYSLIIQDLKKPDENRRIELDDKTLNAIWNDFSEYLAE